MIIKSKMKWVGLFGLVLSAFSLFTHFLLAGYTTEDADASHYQSSITIFSWRPVFDEADLPRNVKLVFFSTFGSKFCSFQFFSCFTLLYLDTLEIIYLKLCV